MLDYGRLIAEGRPEEAKNEDVIQPTAGVKRSAESTSVRRVSAPPSPVRSPRTCWWSKD